MIPTLALQLGVGSAYRDRSGLLAPWQQGPVFPSRGEDEPKRETRRLDQPEQPAKSRKQRASPAKPARDRQPAFRLGKEVEDKPSQPIYVNNTGLVLTGPFLIHLF